MASSLTPDRARQIRQLFEHVAGLVPDRRSEALATASSGDDEFRRQVEALLLTDTHAPALLQELGVTTLDHVTFSRWERLRALFDQVRTLPPPEQATLIARICEDQPTLRADLAALLRSYDHDPAIFDSPPPDTPPPVRRPDAATSADAPTRRVRGDALIGQTIGPYRILERLGRGGMGVVYKARDTRLDRLVALKFLPPYLSADEEAEARFAHEARAASALDHPNIAVVHEIGQSPDGRSFIVMAYYAGETLRDKIRRGPLPLDEALDYIVQIGSGLQRAHEDGIVHRDIKPENVIVTERGRVKIVDFGLAKVTDVNLTRTGMTMGTVAYMSPEQAFGHAVDHRTDLWALGVVLYEMLAGQQPFKGPHEAAVLYATANTDPAPVRELRPDVPEQLSWVVDSLLEKEPTRRYQNTADVVDDLKALRTETASMGQTSVGLTAPTRPAMAATPPSRQPASVSKTSAADESAAAPWLGLPRTAVLSVGAAGLLAAVALIGWLAFGPEAAAPGPGTSVSSETQVPPRQRADAYREQGLRYFSNQAYDRAQAALEQAVQIDSTYSLAWNDLAAVHIRRQAYAQAIASSMKAIQSDSTNHAAYFNRAIAHEELGNLEEAEQAYAQAVTISPRFIEAYSALGNLRIQRGRVQDAITTLERGLDANPASDFAFLLHKNLGKAYLALDQYDRARAFLETSLDQQPGWPETVALMAETYARAGQPSRSQEWWRRYLEVETDPDKVQAARARLAPQ